MIIEVVDIVVIDRDKKEGKSSWNAGFFYFYFIFSGYYSINILIEGVGIRVSKLGL